METIDELKWMEATITDAIERLECTGVSNLYRVRDILTASRKIKQAVDKINEMEGQEKENEN